MKKSIQCLASKYAQAYINIFGVHESQLLAFEQLHSFFSRYKKITFFLSTLYIKKSRQEDVLLQVCKKVGLSGVSIEKIICLLIKDKRLELFPEIIASTITIYRKKLGICMVDVIASHTLDEKSLEVIHAFLVHRMQCTVVCSHKVDPSLIVGIRLQSDTRVWEYSIARQLARVRATLVS